MKDLEIKLKAARKLAIKAYKLHGLSPEYDRAMEKVKTLCKEVDARQSKFIWKCESDGKWYV